MHTLINYLIVLCISLIISTGLLFSAYTAQAIPAMKTEGLESTPSPDGSPIIMVHESQFSALHTITLGQKITLRNEGGSVVHMQIAKLRFAIEQLTPATPPTIVPSPTATPTATPTFVPTSTPTSIPSPNGRNTNYLPLISHSSTAISSKANTQTEQDGVIITVDPNQELSYLIREIGDFLMTNPTDNDMFAPITIIVREPTELTLYYDGDTTAVVGITTTIELLSYDPKGNTIEITPAELPLPDNMTYDANTDILSFQPDSMQAGAEYVIEFMAQTDVGDRTSKQITVNVPVSTSPTLTPTSTLTPTPIAGARNTFM